jgi:hypothetical protein
MFCAQFKWQLLQWSSFCSVYRCLKPSYSYLFSRVSIKPLACLITNYASRFFFIIPTIWLWCHSIENLQRSKSILCARGRSWNGELPMLSISMLINTKHHPWNKEKNITLKTVKQFYLYRIWGSHSGGYEEYHLLGYNAVWWWYLFLQRSRLVFQMCSVRMSAGTQAIQNEV